VYPAPVFTCFAPKTSKYTTSDTFAYFDSDKFTKLINTIPGDTGSTELCCNGRPSVYDKNANMCINTKSNGKGNNGKGDEHDKGSNGKSDDKRNKGHNSHGNDN
jgi:hypothetical protein